MRNIIFSVLVVISLHQLILAQDVEKEASNFRKEQLLADNNPCSDHNNTVSCVLSSGCCWIEADVIILGHIKGCISPGNQRDDSDFC
jgi:hypothetical protein